MDQLSKSVKYIVLLTVPGRDSASLPDGSTGGGEIIRAVEVEISDVQNYWKSTHSRSILFESRMS